LNVGPFSKPAGTKKSHQKLRKRKKAHTLSRDVGLAVNRYHKNPYSRMQRFFRKRIILSKLQQLTLSSLQFPNGESC